MSTADSTADRPAPMRGPSLLVIDDEPAICRFVGRVAEGAGFAVETVSASREARAACKRLKPDVIVLDLSMPDMDGIEVMRQLADDGCTARVVLTTGFDTFFLDAARKIGEVTGLGSITTIAKPLRPGPLRAAITGEPG